MNRNFNCFAGLELTIDRLVSATTGPWSYDFYYELIPTYQLSWSVMRFTLSLFAALLIAACEGPPSPDDAKLKSVLVGSWYYEYKNTHESTVKGVLEHSDTGTFKARERIFQIENPPEEKSAGTWHITSGLFKLLTNEVEGKQLAPRDYLYFTCKVTVISSNEFSCLDEVAKQTYSYKRVPSGFKLS